MKRIEFTVEVTRTGYSAYAVNLPVCTTAADFGELRDKAREAATLYFEGTGRVISAGDIELTLDLPQFFEFYDVINATALSRRIRMNQSLLAQYIGGQKKPSAGQLDRILKGIRQLGRELSEINLKVK